MSFRVVTFGEILLRLTSPDHERLLESTRLEAVFGGAEANVAVALAHWGVDAACVTVLPEDNALADAAIVRLRGHGVDVSPISRRPGRLGLYFMESGAGWRASKVLYDREHSALARVSPGDIPWASVLTGARWFHVTGITPALSESAAGATAEAIGVARASGIRVSFDLNYRENLWRSGASAAETLRRMMAQADVVMANQSHLELVLGERGGDASGGEPKSLERLAERTFNEYPNIGAVGVTVRTTGRGGVPRWSACLASPGVFECSRVYELSDVVDRVGAGDAFAAGLIYGLETCGGLETYGDLETDGELETRGALSISGSGAEALALATAAGCLKHSVPGDALVASIGDVRAVAAGQDGTGRIER